MNKNRFLSVVASAACLFIGSNAFALTLQESVVEALQTNPVVQERLKNFHETQQDLEIVKSEWLPSLDYRGTIGIANAGHFKDGDTSKDKNFRHGIENDSRGNYASYSNSLKLTQNIFNGFSTTHKMNYQEARIMAAAHHYVENANDIAFQMVGAYIDLIRSYKLLQIAKENVAINKKIYEDVQSLYEQGLTNKSEMTKINASLSLANSNLTVNQNNTIDKEARFKRLFGRSVNVGTLEMPRLDFAMPESKERATQIAITNNPSLIVSNFNIKGAQEIYKQKQSKFYPIIDLEFEQIYNDYKNSNKWDSQDDRQRAYVVMNWNLFNGLADVADVQKSKSTINREVEILRDLKRQTIEGLELSWNAYEMIGKQLKDLETYYENSEETLESYQSEYEMGRRTLLDLLSAQNDLVSSKTQIVNAQMDKLYSQYRILDAMGMMVSSIVEDKDYNKLINPTINPLVVVEDELPVNYDVDGDGIVDSLDICDNSVLGQDDITPYGCNKEKKDSDFDGIPDSKDQCPDTPFGAPVDENGCEVDGANKFAANSEDYIAQALQYTENSPVKDSKLGLYDYEFNTVAAKNVQSTDLDKHLYYDDFAMIRRYDFLNMNENNAESLDKIANELKQYNDTNAVVTIIGNTRANSDKQDSFETAQKYANNVKEELQNRGVDTKILHAQSRVDYDRAFLQTNFGDKKLNDVTAVALYVPKASVVAPVQILDDDQDGVPNNLDQCPDTPKGYAVDEYGCTQPINLEILFENNSAKILENSKEKVLAFAKYLNDNKGFDAIIEGHASKEGRSSAQYNTVLSQKRADAVKQLIIDNGVEASRLQSVGKGYNEPVADNSTAEGQAKNRRIQAILVRK